MNDTAPAMDTSYFEHIHFLDSTDSILSLEGAASTERLAQAAGVDVRDAQAYLLELNRVGAIRPTPAQLWVPAHD